MSKLYYAIPTLGLIAGILALVLIGSVPSPATGLSVVFYRTFSVMAFGTATWLIALTYMVPNRFGLYANTLLLISLVTLLTTFGNHTVARWGLNVFGGLVGLSIILILVLHQRLPNRVDEKDYH